VTDESPKIPQEPLIAGLPSLIAGLPSPKSKVEACRLACSAASCTKTLGPLLLLESEKQLRQATAWPAGPEPEHVVNACGLTRPCPRMGRMILLANSLRLLEFAFDEGDSSHRRGWGSSSPLGSSSLARSLARCQAVLIMILNPW